MRTKRILVVEDEAIVAADLQDRLRAMGYDPAGVVAAGEAGLAKAQEVGAATLNYGLFIKALVDFLIVALVMFLLIRLVNRAQQLRAREAPPAPSTRDCPFCLSSIPLKASRCPHCTSELRA